MLKDSCALSAFLFSFLSPDMIKMDIEVVLCVFAGVLLMVLRYACDYDIVIIFFSACLLNNFSIFLKLCICFDHGLKIGMQCGHYFFITSTKSTHPETVDQQCLFWDSQMSVNCSCIMSVSPNP